jgi:Tol biopolymer transport system component
MSLEERRLFAVTRLASLACLLAILCPASTLAVSEPQLRAGNPSWSPDARQVAFDASSPGQASDIYVVNVDGTNFRNLTADDPDVNVLPSWGRRVGHIAYETDFSTPQVADVQYSLVRPDGSLRRELARSTAIGPIYWSVGDRYIAFDGRFEARTLALMTQTTRSIAPARSGPWAPKALRLALGVEAGSNVHLVTASPSGDERRRLTFGREGVRPFAWSPDGGSILFEASRGAASGFNIYVVRMRDQRIVRLAVAAREGDFSPSGRRVVYSLEKGGLFTVSLDGSRRRRLTGDGVMPRWSPDGRWIAFQAGARIDLIHADGSDRHALVGS